MLQIKSNREQLSVREENGTWFINEEEVQADLQPTGDKSFHLILNNKSYNATIEKVNRQEKTMVVVVNGDRIELSIQEPIDLLIKSMGLDLNLHKKAESVKAPMPGMVLKLLVKEGEQVDKGTNLLILEAMKMENVLKASAPGVVKKINVTENTAVEKGTILIEMA